MAKAQGGFRRTHGHGDLGQGVAFRSNRGVGWVRVVTKNINGPSSRREVAGVGENTLDTVTLGRAAMLARRTQTAASRLLAAIKVGLFAFHGEVNLAAGSVVPLPAQASRNGATPWVALATASECSTM